MKKFIAVSIMTLLLFSSSAAAEPCTGGESITKNLGETFSLCWTPNHANDLVKHYVIYRNGLIFQPDENPAIILHADCDADGCFSPEYNVGDVGVKTYVVVAVDEYDYVSDDSNPVVLTVVKPKPSPPAGCSIR